MKIERDRGWGARAEESAPRHRDLARFCEGRNRSRTESSTRIQRAKALFTSHGYWTARSLRISRLSYRRDATSLNLKAAAAIQMNIPQSLILRADESIR
jgi:hypothetical protein